MKTYIDAYGVAVLERFSAEGFDCVLAGLVVAVFEQELACDLEVDFLTLFLSHYE